MKQPSIVHLNIEIKNCRELLEKSRNEYYHSKSDNNDVELTEIRLYTEFIKTLEDIKEIITSTIK